MSADRDLEHTSVEDSAAHVTPPVPSRARAYKRGGFVDGRVAGLPPPPVFARSPHAIQPELRLPVLLPYRCGLCLDRFASDAEALLHSCRGTPHAGHVPLTARSA